MSEADMSTDSLEDYNDVLQFEDSLADSLSACTDQLMERKDDTENEENPLVVVEEGTEDSDEDDDDSDNDENCDVSNDGENGDGDNKDDSDDDEDNEESDDDNSKDHDNDSKDDYDETDVKAYKEEVSGSEGMSDRDPDESLSLGFASLDEMLLQHGEFPAPPLFMSSLRPPSTPSRLCTTTAAATDNHRHGFKFPSSLPSVVSWRTCGGGESLWSPDAGVSFSGSRVAAEENLLWNMDKEGLPGAYLPAPRCSLAADCLLADTRHPPRPAHQTTKVLPPCRYSNQPSTVNWQPPIAHYKNQGCCSSKFDVVDSEEGNSGCHGGKCSPRRAMINNVLNNTRAFRSHPLFPLLRDLAVVDYYFDNAAFNLASLLSFLPPTTEEMVTLYLRRNPQVVLDVRGETQSLAVDAVVLDAVAYTHRSLLEKVQTTTRVNEKEERTTKETKVEDICDRYMDVLCSSTTLQHPQMDYYNVDEVSGAAAMLNLRKDLHISLDSLSHQNIIRAPLSPIPDTNFVPSTLHSTSSYSTTTHNVTSTTTTNAQCLADSHRRMPNTHHSREARDVLRAWLKEHQHYPYPNESQKAALVRVTGLTVQQVTRWLSNARRRHLPRLRADRSKE